MKPGDAAERSIILLELLKTHSDPEHILSMPQLIQLFAEEGIQADRRTIYRSLHALIDSGYPIHYVRKNGQGYYMDHSFTKAESLVLIDAIQNSPSISINVGKQLKAKILNELSTYQADAILPNPPAPGKTTNDEVLPTIEKCMKAIAHRNVVSFRYYDMTITHEKQYRKQKERYQFVPYGIVSQNGRYYCIFYSQKHKGFASYRMDKMDHVEVLEEVQDPQPFDLKRYLQSSFQMYSGSPQTITMEIDTSLTSVVFDQFGQDILISSVKAKSFTASIKSALTPTLVSWILTFYDRLVVKKPESLIQQLQVLAKTIQTTYGKAS